MPSNVGGCVTNMLQRLGPDKYGPDSEHVVEDGFLSILFCPPVTSLGQWPLQDNDLSGTVTLLGDTSVWKPGLLDSNKILCSFSVSFLEIYFPHFYSFLSSFHGDVKFHLLGDIFTACFNGQFIASSFVPFIHVLLLGLLPFPHNPARF